MTTIPAVAPSHPDTTEAPDAVPTAVPDLLPARMVNEFVYCPRLAYLEWVQGEWDDNADTVGGRFTHRRVDAEPATGVPPAEATADDQSLSARSLLLSSAEIGVIARIDLMELDGKRATPVDYKRGSVPDTEHRAYDPERVQLCLQGLILREHGHECDRGVLYFAESRARVEIPFDDELVALTRQAVAGLKGLASSERLPPPLVDSPKCVRCSLVGICLPDEINRLSQPAADGAVRRLVPARDDRFPLYVQEQGAWIGKRDERLAVTVKGHPTEDVRLLEVSQVVLLGNVQVSTPAVRALCEREIPITYHSYGGWFYGMTTGLAHKNIELRIAQHRCIEGSGAGAFPIARAIVAGKIFNQRTLLRRNLPDRDARLIGRLALYVRQARHARDAASLLGTEGIAAREYFGAFPRLFHGAGAWAGTVFSEQGRTRRPPTDAVNAVLSFLYAMLTKECVVVSQAVGFEVYRGVYHTPKYGRPALALDLCEEFRPLIADSVCVTLFNQGELGPRDFITRSRGVALTPAGRRTVIAGYERRLGQMVTHPIFGYTISYRRVIELQARLLRSVILGELAGYRPFSTR